MWKPKSTKEKASEGREADLHNKQIFVYKDGGLQSILNPGYEPPTFTTKIYHRDLYFILDLHFVLCQLVIYGYQLPQFWGSVRTTALWNKNYGFNISAPDFGFFCKNRSLFKVTMSQLPANALFHCPYNSKKHRKRDNECVQARTAVRI